MSNNESNTQQEDSEKQKGREEALGAKVHKTSDEDPRAEVARLTPSSESNSSSQGRTGDSSDDE